MYLFLCVCCRRCVNRSMPLSTTTHAWKPVQDFWSMCHSVFGLLGDCVCNACPTQSATKARLLTMVFTPAFIPLMQIVNRLKATCGLPLWMLRVCVCPGLWWSHDPSDWGNGARVFGAVVITQHIRVGAGGGAPVFRAVVKGWGTCVQSCGDHTTHQGGGTCVQNCGDHTTHQGRGRGWGTCVQSCGDHTTHQGRGWGGAPVFRAVVITQHFRVGAGVGNMCLELWWSHNTSRWGHLCSELWWSHNTSGWGHLCSELWWSHNTSGWGQGLGHMCSELWWSYNTVVGAGDGACVFRAVVIAWHLGTGAHCTELWWSHDKSGWGLGAGHMHVLSCGDHKRVEGGGGGGGTYIYRAVVIAWHVGVGAGGGAPTYTEQWW